MSDFLPEEVIVEILYKLPVKCLLKCTSVCKSWYFLIKSPNFISTHLHRTLHSKDSRHHQNQQLLMFRCYFKERERYFLYLDDNNFSKYRDPYFPLKAHKYLIQLGGSCNGLACLLNRDNIYKFILWNPSIGKFLTLPPPLFYYSMHGTYISKTIGFGFDSTANDYKILRMIQDPLHRLETSEPPVEAELYSLNANSWKIISGIAPRYDLVLSGCDCHIPAYVNGALHWIVMSGRKDVGVRRWIMVFDVKNEVFLDIILPEALDGRGRWELQVKEFKESTIAVIKIEYPSPPFRCDIWAMHQYGVRGSWEKLWSIKTQVKDVPSVWGFRINGELLLGDQKDIVSVNLDDQHVKHLTAQVTFSTFVGTYMESLVLFDKGNNEGSRVDAHTGDASHDVNREEDNGDYASDENDERDSNDAN